MACTRSASARTSARTVPASSRWRAGAVAGTTSVCPFPFPSPHTTNSALTSNLGTDVGASQMMIDGKIKLKNDSLIKRFTKTGLEFEDGSTVDADVVIYATGYVPVSLSLLATPFCVFPCICIHAHLARRFNTPAMTAIQIMGEELTSRIKPVWDLDEEGELRTARSTLRSVSSF